MTALSTADRQRLAAVLGMLGSAHDGEVLNAARTAERLRRSTGETWSGILAPQPTIETRYITLPTQCSCCRPGLGRGWRRLAAVALELGRSARVLTEWEVTFLTKIAASTYEPTAKQQEILERIALSVGVRP